MTVYEDFLSLKQTGLWHCRTLDPQRSLQNFHEIASRQPHCVVFSIADGAVDIVAPVVHEIQGAVAHRTLLYRKFLQDVVTGHGIQGSMHILMDVEDARASDDVEVPIFLYQKRVGEHGLLFPDVDFLGANFYPDIRDDLRYEHKKAEAIFVGSTTGSLITMDMAKNRGTQRLEAESFFRDHPLVTFRLPNIVQCESPEVEACLRESGIGDGALTPFEDQLAYKFVISMDGNGATCSRVVMALASNSVLLKYESQYELFYFSAMEPWRHYIPIRSHQDVLNIVEAERRTPGMFGNIAAEGRRFAERLLRRPALYLYTANLLRRYQNIFQDTAPVLNGPKPQQSNPEGRIFTMAVLHIASVGDVAFNTDDWLGDAGRNPIEGLELHASRGVDPSAIQYTITSSEGTVQQGHCGQFVGSKGKLHRIAGFRISVADEYANLMEGGYEGLFDDGRSVGPCAFGTDCNGENGTALVGFRIYHTLP